MNITIEQLKKNFGAKVAADIENYTIQRCRKNNPVPTDTGLAESRQRKHMHRQFQCEQE